MGITYFGEGKDDRYFERLMQEKPGRESAGQRKRVHLLRCENCSAYDEQGETCRLPTCRFQKPQCATCPYRNGICNVCYREMMKEK